MPIPEPGGKGPPVARVRNTMYHSLDTAFRTAKKNGIITVELLRDCTLGTARIFNRQVVLTGKGTITCTGRSCAFDIMQGSLNILPAKNSQGIRFVFDAPNDPCGKFALVYGNTEPAHLEIHEGVTIDLGGKDNGEGGNVIHVYGKDSTFVMAGGTIQNLYSTRNRHSGAVRVGNGATFTMNRGRIENCHSLARTRAGAVYVDGGDFRMLGGRIVNCGTDEGNMTAAPVYVENGSFEMLGGLIAGTDNGRNTDAGVVHIEGNSRMLLWGQAEISGNRSAGAIHASGSGARISIRSGTIRNNRALCTGANYGGGIFFNSEKGILEIHDGRITDNTAGRFGGGVFFNGARLGFKENCIWNNTLEPDADYAPCGSDLFLAGGLVEPRPAEMGQPYRDSGETVGAWYVENSPPDYAPEAVRKLRPVELFREGSGYIAGPGRDFVRNGE